MGIVRHIGELFYFSKRKNSVDEKKEDLDSSENELLCRFVIDVNGKKIGESIAITNDIIIIKSRDIYLGIPIKHIGEDKKVLTIKGLIDKDKAIELGEKWRKDSFNELT
jgi:hypothetical protein